MYWKKATFISRCHLGENWKEQKEREKVKGKGREQER